MSFQTTDDDNRFRRSWRQIKEARRAAEEFVARMPIDVQTSPHLRRAMDEFAHHPLSIDTAMAITKRVREMDYEVHHQLASVPTPLTGRVLLGSDTGRPAEPAPLRPGPSRRRGGRRRTGRRD